MQSNIYDATANQQMQVSVMQSNIYDATANQQLQVSVMQSNIYDATANWYRAETHCCWSGESRFLKDLYKCFSELLHSVS